MNDAITITAIIATAGVWITTMGLVVKMLGDRLDDFGARVTRLEDAVHALDERLTRAGG